MLRYIVILLAALLSVAAASENLRGSFGTGIDGVLQQIFEKLEAQDNLIAEQTKLIAEQAKINAEQDGIIASLQETVRDLGHLESHRRLNGTIYNDDDCLPRYNRTLGYCIFDLPVAFASNVTFEDNVTIGREGDYNVTFNVNGGKTYFANTTYFDGDVEFSEDATFYDDVTVEGPESSNADPTEFIVKNKVEVTFEEDSYLLVDTESLFRADVTIALDHDDVDYDDRRLDENKAEEPEDLLSRGTQERRRLGHDTYKSKYKDQPKLYFIDGKAEGEIETEDLIVNNKATIDILRVREEAKFGNPNYPGTFKLDVDGTVDADKFQVVTDPDLGTKNVLNGNGLTLDSGNIQTNGGTISGGSVTATGAVSAGTTVTAGTGVTATTGDVTASAGDVVATTGDVIATAGSVSAGTDVTAGGAVTAGTGVTATTGDVTATAGNVIASGCVQDGGGALGVAC